MLDIWPSHQVDVQLTVQQ